MRRRAKLVSVLLMIQPGALLGQPRSAPIPPPIEAAVKAAYQREFGETIEYPAIYNNPNPVDCRGQKHPPFTTTAYLRKDGATTLLTMYISEDGVVQHKTRSEPPLPPVGKIRVLCVLVRYPETVGADALPLWEKAQQQINEDHTAFAKSRGYKAPIVVFDNTNIVVDPAEIDNPHSPASVRAAARHRGVSVADYQIIMAIDINPNAAAGGLSILTEKSVYMGNFTHWKSPLDLQMWMRVAAAAYHHEIAHHWGWPGTHDWDITCGSSTREFEPFIVPPVLFGWENLHGDHVPEILSATPYGRQR